MRVVKSTSTRVEAPGGSGVASGIEIRVPAPAGGLEVERGESRRHAEREPALVAARTSAAQRSADQVSSHVDAACSEGLGELPGRSYFRERARVHERPRSDHDVISPLRQRQERPGLQALDGRLEVQPLARAQAVSSRGKRREPAAHPPGLL